tara:strand:+ start:211 stop:483 length:273 start_codon:yes stop_codon:yes gene_type:complete
MALSDKTNLLVQPYVRTQYPVLDEGIKRYIQDELQRIETSLRSLSQAAIQVTEDPPEQPVKGMVRYAVSPWNPGSGDGLYIYNGTAWVLV